MHLSKFFTPIVMSILLITTVACQNESKEDEQQGESEIGSEEEESGLQLSIQRR